MPVKPPAGLEPATCGLQNHRTDATASDVNPATSGDNTPDSDQAADALTAPLTEIAQAMAGLTEDEQAAVLEHLRAMVKMPRAKREALVEHVGRVAQMSPAKRTAIMSLAD